MKEINLTTNQRELLNKGLDILHKNNRLLIIGKAGTGKTTLINFLLKELKNRENKKGYKKSICSAPTNKAVRVLKEKIDSDIPENYFQTTHSALKLKRIIDNKNGTVDFIPDIYGSPPLKWVSILIIDEASMLNSKLLEYIEEFSKNIKIIFIGDEAQLPPVGEEISPVFTNNYPVLELKEIIRQEEGNPIIDLSRDLSLIKTRIDRRTSIGGYIFSNDTNKVIETLANVNGTDDLKYLAWTNREVDYINNQVRKRIYGNPSKIELGESLVFNTPYDDFFTNEEIVVSSLNIIERDFLIYSYPNLKYNAENLDEPETIERKETIKLYQVNSSIFIVHEDSEKLFKDILKDLSSRAKSKEINWEEYYKFVENFADIKYNHALTVHKSQGSTYGQVIINIKDLFLNTDLKEREKLLYTAITRAKELVILYKT